MAFNQDVSHAAEILEQSGQDVRSLNDLHVGFLADGANSATSLVLGLCSLISPAAYHTSDVMCTVYI